MGSSDPGSGDMVSSNMASREAQPEGGCGTSRIKASRLWLWLPRSHGTIPPWRCWHPARFQVLPPQYPRLGTGGLGSMTLRPGSFPLSPDPPQQSERDRHRRPEVAQDLVLI